MFRFPLLREHSTGPLREAQASRVLLHGLNERSFTKYIPWAYQIWTQAQIPVAMFPLPFHINRVRREWGRSSRPCTAGGRNAGERIRAPVQCRDQRAARRPSRTVLLGCHAGVLGHHRSRGSRSVPTVIRISRADARVDVLGFSAGGYVALALLLENHRGISSDSRGVMFGSCCAVRDVNLSSPLILDHAAEVALMKCM